MAKKIKGSNLSLEDRLEQALIPNWDEPYKLPENWCWVRVDAIASIYTGNSINERVKEEKYTGRTDGLVYLATKDIDFDSTIDYDTNVCIPQSDGFKVAPEYSTLLCIEGGSAGRKIGFTTQDVCFVNKLCAFVPHGKINPKYLYYVIQSDAFKKQFDEKKHGLIGGVSVKEVSSIFIPFAPVETQNKIVELIESVFNKLDESKEKAQEVVGGFETRKAAILYKAFSGELTAKWREENNISFENWGNKLFDECIEKMQNGLAKRRGSEGIPYVVLRLANLSDDGFITDDLREIILDEKEQKSYKLNVGDVVMIRVNGSKDNVAKQILVTENNLWAFCDHIIRIKYNESVLPEYMVLYSKSETYKIYVKDNIVSSAGQNTISRKGMACLSIPVPQISEQREIVRILSILFAKERNVKETAEAVINQIGTMKKAILARAFRGELGTNDPSEESAVELLKQVLNTVPEQKNTMKRTVIPKSLECRIKTDLERKIIKLYIQNEVNILTVDLIMGVSSKKFDIIETLRSLQQRGILEKENDKYKLLG